MAIAQALKMVTERKLNKEYEFKKIVLITDSQITLRRIQKLMKFKR
jgi:hypothetical protein